MAHVPDSPPEQALDSREEAERLGYRDYPAEGPPATPDAIEASAEGVEESERAARPEVALCLSGGGIRAALFHSGAVRRLAEVGALARVSLISSVSGGSIFSAFMMERLSPWPTGPVSDFEDRVGAPFRRLAHTNLRRGLPAGLLQLRSFVETMERTYRREVNGLTLAELPEHPRYIFSATDLGFGVNWVFERERVGSYRAGYVRPPSAEWTVARAVAASSCFPPVFRPMRLSFDEGELAGAKGKAQLGERYAHLIKHVRLSDGGVYDNLGLQPALSARAPVVLVSDGGAPMRRRAPTGLFGELLRYPSVLQGQVGALRKSGLISLFEGGALGGTYWGISSATSSYDSTRAGSTASSPNVPGYSKAFARDQIARIRTDLDAFSEGEAAVLENHGYALAEAALLRHAPHLIAGDKRDFSPPHPAWLDEGAARPALQNSGKTVIIGRNSH